MNQDLAQAFLVVVGVVTALNILNFILCKPRRVGTIVGTAHAEFKRKNGHLL